MAETSRCCDDIAVHSHDGRTLRKDGQPYTYRFAFKPSWPKLNTYRAAERRWIAFSLNRYPGIVIGAGVQVGTRVLGLRWGRPGRVIELPS
jgi:hypothetical protein